VFERPDGIRLSCEKGDLQKKNGGRIEGLPLLRSRYRMDAPGLSVFDSLPGLIWQMFEARDAEVRARRLEIATHFKNIANALEELADKLHAAKTRNDIPSKEGNTLETLIRNFAVIAAPISSKKDKGRQEELRRMQGELDRIADNARKIDLSLLLYSPDIEKNKGGWIREMRQLAGKFIGTAKLLEVTAT
jgi:hypothetical protein